ncbi:NUDIX domain-containing protein, partial [Candidatus Saccharibacteria bacterium]|nr:NUDIX domain-containing protein [Candidatus Saccharibacteria bacterium]
MKTEVVQKAVVVNDHGDILMLRRSKTDVRRPLQWDLPGGIREADEELMASVLREIHEETKLVIHNAKPFFTKTEVRTWENDQGKQTENVVFIFYLAHTNNSEIKLSYEHDKAAWKPATQALKEFQYPLHQEVLRHLINNRL